MTERVAIITGATSGIGEAVAQQAAERGFRVVITGRRAERLEAVAAEFGVAAARWPRWWAT